MLSHIFISVLFAKRRCAQFWCSVRKPLKVKYINKKALTDFVKTVGAFKDDGTLMVWIFQWLTQIICWRVLFLLLSTGFLSANTYLTQCTDEKYFGHGYGAHVTDLSKIIAELGYDMYSDIFETNQPSRKLFSKYEFKVVGETHWISTKITWTPDDEWMETFQMSIGSNRIFYRNIIKVQIITSNNGNAILNVE